MSRLRWRNWPLAAKLTLPATLLAIAGVSSVAFPLISRQQQADRTALERQARLTLDVLSAAGTGLPDADRLVSAVEQLSDEGEIVFARVYDAEGSVVAAVPRPASLRDANGDSLGRRLAEGGAPILEWHPDRLVAGEPVTVGAEPAGAIGIALSTAPLEAGFVALRARGYGAIAAAAIAATVLSLLLSRVITGPLQRLAAATGRIAGGDLSREIAMHGGDEIASLGNRMEHMRVELLKLYEGLEQLMAERTRDLETNLEIGRHLSTILDSQELVEEVVDRVQEATGYYHVRLYLVDESCGDLVIVAATGEAGRAMVAQKRRIPPGKGLVARAASTNGVVLAPNVLLEKGWVHSFLLPDTRCEVAVPIALGERVLGVLDVHHDVVDGIGESNVKLLQSVAGQAASALQNIRLLVETRQRAHQEASLNLITRRIQSTSTVEGALKATLRELGRTLDVQYTSVKLEQHP